MIIIILPASDNHLFFHETIFLMYPSTISSQWRYLQVPMKVEAPICLVGNVAIGKPNSCSMYFFNVLSSIRKENHIFFFLHVFAWNFCIFTHNSLDYICFHDTSFPNNTMLSTNCAWVIASKSLTTFIPFQRPLSHLSLIALPIASTIMMNK